MEAVEHQGLVESIQGKTMRVRIEQTSACSGCHAQKVCSSADRQDKWIDISCFAGEYQIGQTVTVTGQSTQGLQAVALAYLLPLILMIFGLAISYLWLFPANDGVSALIALSVTILYYLSLYSFRKKLQSRFVFTVKSFDKKKTVENDGNKNNCL